MTCGSPHKGELFAKSATNPFIQNLISCKPTFLRKICYIQSIWLVMEQSALHFVQQSPTIRFLHILHVVSMLDKYIKDNDIFAFLCFSAK